jgi:PIN domain nuclease of toxin-antitoxin system
MERQQMKYLLDTHVWYWLMEAPEKIPDGVKKILRHKDAIPFGISAISLWEIAKLEEKGKINFNIPLQNWMKDSLDPGFMKQLELDEQVAVESTRLPEPFHRDPADQIIVATARVHNLTLITADRKILAYRHVRTLWD